MGKVKKSELMAVYVENTTEMRCMCLSKKQLETMSQEVCNQAN